MRKFLIFIALFLSFDFVFGGYVSFNTKAVEPYTVRVVSQSGNEVVVEFTLNGIITNDVVIDGKKYSKFDIPGSVNYLNKGMPELPHINENVIVENTGKVQLSIISQKTEKMQFAPPVPSKGNLYRSVDPKTVKYCFSKEYFVKRFPSQEIGISKPFIMRDFRGVNVEINPIIYDPVRNEYTIIKSIRFAITTTALLGTNELKRSSFPKKIDKDFDNIYRTNFLNYRDVQFRYSAVKEQGGMLIIAADNLYNTMIPFYLWKLQKGIPCKMVKLSDIGGNNEDSIKNYIQNEYDKDTIAYILLVGDGGDITPATGTVGSANGADCDPVYTYLSGDDYYPDAIIGRFSASDTTDIKNMVNRSINYEMNPDFSGAWYHKAMGLGSTQGSPSDSERVAWLRDSLLTYNYTSVDLMIDGYQNATDISKYLKEGRSCVYYCGHGATNEWETPTYTNSNVQALSNTNMLPFVQSVACLVGNFNGNDCFAENWLKAGSPNAPAGGIDFYGSTIEQSWVPPTVSQTEFIHLLINEINSSVGALYFNGSCKMIEQYGDTATDGVEMFQTWTIFGDPSIQVRTNNPEIMTVNHDSTIVIGQNTFNVSTPGVVNALCGLYNPSDSTLVAHGYTDASGNVSLDLNPPPSSPEILILTVTAMNKIPVVDTIYVGPYVSYLSSIVGDTSGNNNGQINPGESIDLSVYLKNFGTDSAHNVYAKISTSDSFLTVTGDSVYFGNIAPDDSLIGGDTYGFSVGQVPDGYSIPFNMTIVSSETTWTTSFRLTAYAPNVSEESFGIDDSTTGNNNGKWDIGEQVKLIFGIKNNGGEVAKNVSINISTSTSGVTINDGSAVIGDIESDSTASNTSDALMVTSDSSMTNGTPVVINYTISGNNFSDISGSVNAVVGVVGQKAYIIFDIDPNHSSGTVMDSILNELGYSGDYYTSFSPMIDSLSRYKSAFVFAGIYSSNTVIDTVNGGKLASWCINNGGMLYLEGGDMWYYDPQYSSGYNFSSLCGVKATDDGSSDLTTIGGATGTFTKGMSFGYSGENNYIDHIDASGSGFVIFSNSSPSYNCGVANDAGSYRTVGMSFEFGGLTDSSGVSTKSALADSIMHFFGLEPQGISEHSLLKSRARKVNFGIRARGSNIVKGTAEFSYGLTKSGRVEVSVYDASGRMVKRLVRGEEKSGYHTVSWDGRDGSGKNVRRGIYFVRLSSSGKSKTAKLLIMR